jgi:hypothetical protein
VARKAFLVRLPEELLDELRGWAEQEMRSLNGQIEFLLRQALVRRSRGDAPLDRPRREDGSSE